MDVKFGQILTANDIPRAEVTRHIANLLTAGISLDDLLVDIQDGFTVAGVHAVVALTPTAPTREVEAVSSSA